MQDLHTYCRIGGFERALETLIVDGKDTAIRLRAKTMAEPGNVCTLVVTIDNWFNTGHDAGLSVFALPGTAAAEQGIRQGLPFGETEKWQAIETWAAMQWNKGGGGSRRSPLPTRLIMVGSSSDAGVRLVETASLPADLDDLRYTALSYRWGSTNTLITTAEAVQELMAHTPLSRIPRTIRDAVQVTRRLGVRFLWVDALCIIQDDKEDWAKEAARMGDVYMNAYCTIAAHASRHADHGFLKESLQREKVIAVGGHPNGEPFEAEMAAYRAWSEGGAPTLAASRPFDSEAFFVARASHGRLHLDRSELSSRGWVLQERILSPRIIHFGPRGSLYFESRDGVEHVETGSDPKSSSFRGLRGALAVLHQRQHGGLPKTSTTTLPETANKVIYRDWYNMVTRYSECFLTNSSDKLVALSGIIQKCEELVGDTCMSGIWANNLIYCLLWLRRQEPLKRNLAAPAPTWSWASVDGKIQYHDLESSSASRLFSAGWLLQPELQLVGSPTKHTNVLELDGAALIKAELNFRARPRKPAFDNFDFFAGIDHDSRYWDVHHGSGRQIGWASLDHETRGAIDGQEEGITCIRVASHYEHIRNRDRGYMVLFVLYSAESDAWQRVGMGQIVDRTLFDGEGPARIRLA
jgi:hypothetical protein